MKLNSLFRLITKANRATTEAAIISSSVRFTWNGTFSDIVGNSAENITAFKDHITTQLATKMAVNKSRIINMEVRAGNVSLCSNSNSNNLTISTMFTIVLCWRS